MKKTNDIDKKIKRTLSIAYKVFEDIIGIVAFLMLVAATLFFTLLSLSLIPIWINEVNHGVITSENFTYYYIGCVFSSILAILYNKLSRKILFSYPIEYKKYCGINRFANAYYSMFFGAGIFSDRLFIYVFYLGLIYLDKKLWLSGAIYTADLRTFLGVNQISIVLLGVVDLVVGEFRKTRELFGYGFKVWLEVALLERLDIMPKSTKRRIRHLLSKEKYKNLFTEFNYVADEMGSFTNEEFVKYAKEIDLKNKEHYFMCYYQASLKKAIILKNNDEDVQTKIIEYLKNYFTKKSVIAFDDIMKNKVFSCYHSCFFMATRVQFENCNKLISKYGYELWYEILENEEVFLKVQKIANPNQNRRQQFCIAVKKAYKEIMKD